MSNHDEVFNKAIEVVKAEKSNICKELAILLIDELVENNISVTVTEEAEAADMYEKGYDAAVAYMEKAYSDLTPLAEELE